MKNERGQVIVLFLLLLPFISAALLYLVNLSHVVFEQMRLQGAVDRAVYAGAAHLSYRLNEITNLNRQANELMENLRREYRRGHYGSQREGVNHFQDMERLQEDLYQQMLDISDHGYPMACGLAKALAAESEAAVFLPLNNISNDCSAARPMTRIYRDETTRLIFHEMEGVDMDPNRAGVQHHVDAIPRYLRDLRDWVSFGGMVVKEIPQFIGPPKRLVALAAARPVAGDITDFHSIYEPQLVPVRELKAEEVDWAKEHCGGIFCEEWENINVGIIQH